MDAIAVRNESDDSIAVKVARMEMQLLRYSSDLESEKRTRADTNSDLTRRMESLRNEFREAQEKTNRILYMLIGGLTALQVVLQFVKH
jgi:hypothetical protein